MSTNTLKQALEIVYGDIKNISKRVKNLESASIGVLYTETTKSAVAYQDNVSANACPYALLNKVGGMSYKVLDNDTNEYVIRDTAVLSVISKDSNDTVLQTINIPQEIQQLEGYGWGINDTCYNYIDFVNKKFNKYVGSYVIKSTDVFGIEGNRLLTIDVDISDNKQYGKILIDDDLTPRYSYNDVFNNDNSIAITIRNNKAILLIYDSSITTAESGKTAFVGKIIRYELATPIETDISSLLPADFNSIQIEPNGTITFDNQYQQAIPYEYLYLEKVGANNE